MTGFIEDGQPTPRQIAEDALRSIPSEELFHAVPAQTPEEDRIEDMYTPEELSATAQSLSEAITSTLGIKDTSQIKDRIPLDNGTVTHHYLPEGNHRWTVLEAGHATRRVLEVRTGPFHDDATGKDYPPEIKVTKFNGGAPLIIPSGRTAFREGSRILGDVLLTSPIPPGASGR